tara:strand:+ start:982374 stop:983594 length:1221 start_codon:yes stop_codon:yes gene_type:complete
MKSLYYRSQKISTRSLVMLTCVALATILVVEFWPEENSDVDRDIMTSAAYQTEAAFDSIHCRRVELGHKMLHDQDPAGTGMLGPSMSLVTTLPGHLDAKQTSVNPNFAAVAVKYLIDAGAQPGDRVAIGCTGSFPALNIAVIAAAEAMGLKPVLVSSAASSQFGANHPDLMWPDIEKSLFEEGIIGTRSVITSRGGFLDKAAGMTSETKQLLDAALQRSGTDVLEANSIEEAIDQRMKVFADAVGQKDSAGKANGLAGRYAAYVNIGGGAASVGGTDGNELLGSGLILPRDLRRIESASRENRKVKGPIDCVAIRFLRDGVPVINMINVVHVAEKHGLAVAPVVRPAVGESNVYASKRYRKWLALAGILFILLVTSLIVRPPMWITRILTELGMTRSTQNEPTWMV